MALTAWESDLFSPLLFGGLPGIGELTQRGAGDSVRGIPLDVIGKEDSYVIKADIPGVGKENIKLSVEGDTLTLSVQSKNEKKEEKEVKGMKIHRQERSQSWARRSVRLPEHADLSKVSARYTDGVLHVEVPRVPESEFEKSRHINIE